MQRGQAAFLVVGLLAVVAAALVFVLAVHAAPRLVRRAMRDRSRIVAAGVPAAAAGAGLLLAWFPMEEATAKDAVVYLSVLSALALAAASGLALGLPAIRLREDYLAIVAIGAAEILRSVLQNEEWLSHGTLGVRRLHRPVVDWALTTPWWQSLADAVDVRPVILAHLVVGALALAYIFVVLELLAASPWGRVLRAVREDEDVARSLGKDVSSYKLQALMIGSAVGGFAGILLVWNLSNIYPEHFPPLVTFFAFIIVIVGGIGNHRGALVGTVVLWGVFELARNLTILQEWGIADLSGPPQAIVIGVLLVLVVMFRPHGLVGRKEELVHAR